MSQRRLRPHSTPDSPPGARQTTALGASARAALLCAVVCLPLLACSSTSRATAKALDEGKPQFASETCQQAIRSNQVHQTLYIGRLIATPVIVVLTAGSAAPLLIGGNVAMDTADRVDASKMSQTCGGPGRTGGQIATDVAGNAALGAATGAALDGVAGGDGLASRLSRFFFGGTASATAK
ncbi:MAG: hypothetical protein FGM40_06535 [Rhodocyclaceae bacterium]|nr:hypothetical protein [Rhodocyclaceae bacterium]